MRHFLASALMICALVSVGRCEEGASAPSVPLGLNDYFAELDRWSDAAKILKQHPEKAADLRKDLPREWPVSVRGQNFSVPTDWLRVTLESLEVNHWLANDYSKEIQTRLAAMRAEAEAFDRASAPGPEIARAKLDEILRRREFHEVRGPTWWERLQETVSIWLAELIAKLFGGLSRHPSVGNLLLWAIVAGLAVLLLIWLFRYFLGGAGSTELELRAPTLPSRAWTDWAREALAFAGRGEYREAIRLGYWAGIYRLEDLGVWRVDRARTHREYLRLLAADQARRAPLSALTSRFELVWYGGTPASADDFESVVAQLEELGCKLRWQPATASS